MALKDLYYDPASFKYNSKNNKYDKDIRGGGYSGQPWQKATVPQTALPTLLAPQNPQMKFQHQKNLRCDKRKRLTLS